MVDGGARGFHEVVKNLFEGLGFTCIEGVPINIVSSNELVMH
jgi:hypothetical protein